MSEFSSTSFDTLRPSGDNIQMDTRIVMDPSVPPSIIFTKPEYDSKPKQKPAGKPKAKKQKAPQESVDGVDPKTKNAIAQQTPADGPKPKTKPTKSQQVPADGAKKVAARPAKPKGPKGAKPKPVAHEFYYQQLAEEMAETMRKDLAASNRGAPTSPALAKFVQPRRQSTFVQPRRASTFIPGSRRTSAFQQSGAVITKEGEMITVVETVFSRAKSTFSTQNTQVHSAHQARPTPKQMLSRLFNPTVRKFEQPGDGSTIMHLDDVSASTALEGLMEKWGGVQHGGMLDKQYHFFVNAAHDAAISFIIKDKVAVLGGDPLCDPSQYASVLAEFKRYRKHKGLKIAILGGGPELLAFAKKSRWVTMRFGTEQVLNPMNNPVLQQKAQKQVIRQNKQLLDPARGGLTLHVYQSSTGADRALESQLAGVYEAWRNARNESGVPQAYTTIYDPFAMPSLMIYIYTRDRAGVPNGFAALRRMGNRDGYYIDPCVAAPGAPRRITDLLYFSAMAMLNTMGCGYLTIGMEPAAALEISGFSRIVERAATRLHGRLFKGLKLAGKQEYFGKFRPDEALSTGVYLMFPSGVPGPRHVASVLHATNISIRKLIKTKMDYKGTKGAKGPQEEAAPAVGEGEDGGDA